MSEKTRERVKRTEPLQEDESGCRQETGEDNRPAEEEAPRIRTEPYFPEIFVG
jgi:hypothetical protein